MFKYIEKDTWDISKYAHSKDDTKKFNHFFLGGYKNGEATGRKVDVDGNLQLLCAIVMGKLMKPMLQLGLVHQLLNMVKIIILIFGIKSL